MAKSAANCNQSFLPGGISEITSQIEDSRFYRLEVRTPDGARRFYSIKAKSKLAARKEGVQIIQGMIKSFNDERIMWRMVGDRNWIFGMQSAKARVAIKSAFDRFAYYFFGLE